MVPENSALKAALNRIIETLEPVPFESFGSRRKFEAYLADWPEYVKNNSPNQKSVPAAQKGENSTQDEGIEEEAGFDSDENATENRQSISEKRQRVAASEIIRATANALDHDIMFMAGNKFLFVNTHWVKVPDNKFKQFLRDCSIAMAVDRLLAPDVNFIDGVSKQIDMLTEVEAQGYARNLMNFLNGTLFFTDDGKTTFKPHQKTDHIRYVLNYEYDPGAKCPRWEQFLDEVIPEEGKQENLAEFLGSCFSQVKHEKIMLLYGTGANGKSVVLEVTTQLFGENNLSHNTLEEITNSNGYFRGNLMDSILNYAGDISDKVNPDGLKILASREPMNGRYVWGRPFEVKDYCRSAFNCNQLPEAKDTSDGFFRRFLIIPFEKTIPEERRNPNLPVEICKDDLPGIMNCVVEGLQRLLKNEGRFTYCPASEQILKQYREEADSVKFFVQHMPKKKIDGMLSSELMSLYRSFCQEHELVPVSVKQFSKDLIKNGMQKTRKSSGVIYRFPNAGTSKTKPASADSKYGDM